ncbi:hypothetical protein QBC45DRAFT_451603 [Copromyces sp. CBS 386.78]|nr:hypothetical protein QBC45DRAFT_451603 [Copromyces sp. CBS 386.78]
MANLPDPTLPAWYREDLADCQHNVGSDDPEPFIRGMRDEPVKYGAVIRVKPRPKPCWEGIDIYMSVDPVPEKEDEGYGEGEMSIDEDSDSSDEETLSEPNGWLEPDIGEAEGGLEIVSDSDALYFIFKDVRFPKDAGRYRVRRSEWLWPKGIDLSRFGDEFFEGYFVGFLGVNLCTEVIENLEIPYEMEREKVRVVARDRNDGTRCPFFLWY